jgi:hypothetical protein
MASWSLENDSALCPLPYASKQLKRWGGPLAAPVASPAYPPLHELCIEKSDMASPRGRGCRHMPTQRFHQATDIMTFLCNWTPPFPARIAYHPLTDATATVDGKRRLGINRDADQ